ncbi:hypothetical protein MAP00_007966 [Monascus purpureus]|nr:hypothetical protein MAP00_007966 [Monascus purpureus]
MKPSGWILLAELVVTPPGTLHYIEDRMQRILDMDMFTYGNSRECTVEDWGSVVAAAGKLSILNIRKPSGSLDSIIEVGFS